MPDAKTQSIIDYLSVTSASHPAFAEHFAKFEDLYTRRLWHQLTLELEEFVAAEGSAPLLRPLYDTFVVDFKQKLNKLALARIQVAVAKQISELGEQVFFCNAAADDAKEEHDAASFVRCELARFYLDAGQVSECKAKLDEAGEYIEAAANVPQQVHAAYYRTRAAYFKVKGPAADFYKNALKLLAYSSLDAMTKDEALTISFDLGVAALVGEGLYNFGELLEHPVVATLEATEYTWLADLLRAFSAGDLSRYEALVAANHTKLESQPALLANTTFLKEKITLMALSEMLFQRISGQGGERIVSFSAIAEAARLPFDQVELLIMRALSLGLIRGVIDQVDATLRVTWVQPRVLQMEQIGMMAERLKTWCGTVDKTLHFLENETEGVAS